MNEIRFMKILIFFIKYGAKQTTWKLYSLYEGYDKSVVLKTWFYCLFIRKQRQEVYDYRVLFLLTKKRTFLWSCGNLKADEKPMLCDNWWKFISLFDENEPSFSISY